MITLDTKQLQVLKIFHQLPHRVKEGNKLKCAQELDITLEKFDLLYQRYLESISS